MTAANRATTHPDRVIALAEQFASATERVQHFERLTALLDECEAQLERLAEWAAPNPAITESRGIALAVLAEARDILAGLVVAHS